SGFIDLGNSTVTVKGNLDLRHDLIRSSTGTLVFSNTAAQTVSAYGQSLPVVVSSNTSSSGLTFNSSFSATKLFLDTAGLGSSATIYFAGNSTATISTITVNGTNSFRAALKSTDSTVSWRLNNTSQNSVFYTEVQRSSASAGLTVFDTPG